MAAPTQAVTPQTPFALVQNQTLPDPGLGPRVVPFSLNFSTSAQYDLNLINFIAQKKIDKVQGVFVDNSANAVAVSIYNPQTNQTVWVPPYYQAYVPVFSVLQTDLLITSTGSSATINLFLYNVPMPPMMWASVGPASQGTIPVSDLALDACIVGNALKILNEVYTGGDVIRPMRQADSTVCVRITTAATTTLLTGSTGMFIDWIDVRLSGVATQAVAGIINISLVDDAGPTTILQADVYVPSSALNASEIIVFDIPPGMGWRSTGNASHLKLVLSAALNAGSIIVNMGAATTSI